MSRSNQPDKIADGSADKKTLDCADFLIAFLERMGVECVFGVPGGAIEPLGEFHLPRGSVGSRFRVDQ